MPPPTTHPGSVRSAAAVNEAIRALVAQTAGRGWTPEERAEYEQLLEEWDAARTREADGACVRA